MTERHEGAIARLAARGSVRGAAIWGLVFGLFFVIVGVGYSGVYETQAERAAVAEQLTGNLAFEALLGPGRELETVGGFTAWRIGSFVALISAVWGFLVATRLLRGEEEEGRWDALLSGPATRVGATAATLAGIGAGIAALWGATAAGLLVLATIEAEVTAGGSLYLALAVTVTGAAFAAVGALTAQLLESRRAAAGLAAAIFGAALLARVAADSSGSLDWLRWATPFGWALELRPFAGPRPLMLLPLLGWTVAFSGSALLLARGRDVGGAVLRLRSDRRAHTGLLGSPLAVAGRAALGGLAGWAVGLGITGFVFGLLTQDIVAAAGELPGWDEMLGEIGLDLTAAEGYLGLIFLLVAVAVSLYAAGSVSAWRDEESHGRLDLVLSRPHGRHEWLGGRIAVAALATAMLALLSGFAAWLGMAVRGADGPSFAQMVETGVNMIPLALSFLGLGVLLFGLVPRVAAPALYGLVAAAFIWELVGEIAGAPGWLLGLSPIHHLALVPATSIDLVASGAMLAVGAAAGAAGMALFRRRDLVEG